MKSYSKEDLVVALRSAGIEDGDTVFLTTRLYNVGKLEGVKTKHHFCETIYEAIREVIKEEGTLVVPTFSQQVASHGVTYIHEQTPCRTGVFCEYIRESPLSIRSFHPVFSLSAIGPKAKRICEDVSCTGFGYDSAMERLFRFNAKAACLGFDYYTGHIVSGMHCVETLYGVPYFYSKIVTSDAYINNKKSEREFVINVRYLDFDISFYYNRFIDLMAKRKHISESIIGSSVLYVCNFEDMFNDGFDLLNRDVYAFIKCKPKWKKGVIPLDGCAETLSQEEANRRNWTGV